MPTYARNHAQSRKCVCILCFGRCKTQLTPTVRDRIHLHIQKDIKFEDPNVPSGICPTCRLKLQKKHEGQRNPELPNIFDFQTIVLPKFLRSAPLSCNCLICRSARKQGREKKKKKRGRPSLDEKAKITQNNSPETEKLCTKCLTVLKRGKKHKCNLQTQSKNLKTIAQRFPKAAEKLASSVIKQKDASPKGTIRLSQFAGPKMPLVPGSSKSDANANIMSTEDMVVIQQSTHLSNRKMRSLAACLNRFSQKGSGVEKNFQRNFTHAGKVLEEFFDCSKSNFEVKGKLVERIEVFCNDIEGFIWTIISARNYSLHDTLVKLSLDNGGSFFKISLSILDVSDDAEEKSFTQPFAAKRLSSGVNRIFVVGIVQKITENYKNISNLLGKLAIEKIKFVLTADLKTTNILCGIQSHSSKHPCSYCDIDSDNLISCGKDRTFGSIRSNTQQFRLSKSKSAKEFLNCTNEPLLPESDNTKVIEAIAPPELHLLLGIVNHLFSSLAKVWPLVQEWPKRLHIKPAAYHGGESFNGPSSHKLLQNIDTLDLLVQSNGAFHAQPWIPAFQKFQQVVHSCFGMNLDTRFCIRKSFHGILTLFLHYYLD